MAVSRCRLVCAADGVSADCGIRMALPFWIINIGAVEALAYL